MNKSTVALYVKLANHVIAQSEINASEGIHTAGWALRYPYAKMDSITPRVKSLLLMDYIQGKVMLIPAEWQRDMFSGKDIYLTGESVENDIRVIRRDAPFYEVAKRKLDAVLETEPARTFLADYGVRLRELPGLIDQHQARSDYYALRDVLKPVIEIVEQVMDSLIVGAVVQERTLAKLFIDTPLESTLDANSRKHLTVDKVRACVSELVDTLEANRVKAFEPLRPVDTQDALHIVGNPHCRKLIEQYAERLATQLHRQRFWLAFALTQGELYERIARVTPELMDVSKMLEEVDEPLSLLGYYDDFDREAIASIAADPQEERLERDSLQWNQLHDVSQLMSETLAAHDDMYYSEDGSRVKPDAFSGGGTTFEDLIDTGKIPVHIHRAVAIETKIDRLRETKRELEDIATVIGKRANDYDWVIEQSDFDLLDMKEQARKLMLPTQSEIENGEVDTYVSPAKAMLDINRATSTIESNKRYF